VASSGPRLRREICEQNTLWKSRRWKLLRSRLEQKLRDGVALANKGAPGNKSALTTSTVRVRGGNAV